MANTYTQLYAQIIFCPSGRQNLIQERFKDNVYKYITGIFRNKKQKLMIINGMPDHVHIFIGFSPDIALSALIGDVKSCTTNFINERKFTAGNFSWQSGFGAFTYSKSQVPNVISYIQKQASHHKRKSFKQEYLELLKKFEIDYNEKYLFEWYE
jgi:REP element-mobilizing transposase RayT